MINLKNFVHHNKLAEQADLDLTDKDISISYQKFSPDYSAVAKFKKSNQK